MKLEKSKGDQMFNSKAVLIPMSILLIALIRQVAINWGVNTSAMLFNLFGVILIGMILLNSLLISRKKRKFGN